MECEKMILRHWINPQKPTFLCDIFSSTSAEAGLANVGGGAGHLPTEPVDAESGAPLAEGFAWSFAAARP